MDFTQTRFSSKRSLLSYAKIQGVIATFVRNRHIFLRQQSLQRKEYLDIGCASNTHKDFINLDFAWLPDIDICWDVTKGIPLPEGSIRGIFSEHCLEHLTLEAADGMLDECKRLLKPGGTLRIIVPDGEIYLTSYVDHRHGKISQLPYAENDNYKNIYSPMMSINRIFRAHGHLFIYDFETLSLLLERKGFTNISRECFGKGRDPRLLIDSAHRACESLYIEASV